MDKIKTVHIADGRSHRALCGSSGNAVLNTRVAHGHIPHGVNCLRCIKSFDRAFRGRVVGTRRDVIIGTNR